MVKEKERLEQHYSEKKNWLKWGPYLSERQWGTVREDYSEDGSAWDYFPHDHARSRVYRWGEDGIAGISDDKCRICFALTLWNGRDPILKERLFGLTSPQGNHGEDVKELYYYLDNTPTHSYMKYLYKYGHRAYPYDELLRVNAERTVEEYEYEILDSDWLENDDYFDIYTEYAKNDEEDICVRITVKNRSLQSHDLYLLPTLWFRNLWSFEMMSRDNIIRKSIDRPGKVVAYHNEIGNYALYFDEPDAYLFTNNENNAERLFGKENALPLVKDRFHDLLVNHKWEEEKDRFGEGTKFAPLYYRHMQGGEEWTIHLRFTSAGSMTEPLDEAFHQVLGRRKLEANEFYDSLFLHQDKELQNIQRQAWAGMLWSKQYYNYNVSRWLTGDPGRPAPPRSRLHGRNHEWKSLHNEDVLSMPDKWEYPWYAAWDTAFHCIPLARLDIQFAKDQLLLFLKESYMHPNGQIPAYEWHFSDVNPPVHGWAALEVFKMDRSQSGVGDIKFLKRVFNKLSLNFTWWVNRKDRDQNNIFEGGFLGLDNIGIFDRNVEIEGGGYLKQADSTAWMALFALNMLEMAIEIAVEDDAFEDMAIKYFEHFIYIAEALNRMDEHWAGIWHDDDGFFYDVLVKDDRFIPIRIRSIVGLTTLFAVLRIESDRLDKLPRLRSGIKNFVKQRRKNQKYEVIKTYEPNQDLFLTLIPQERMKTLVSAMIDPNEFFSDYGIRSLSKIHSDPFYMNINGIDYSIAYDPGESTSLIYGGNSNWRGPIWFPINYLIIQTLQKYHEHFGDNLTIQDPQMPEKFWTTAEISQKIACNLISIFREDGWNKRPVNLRYESFYQKEENRDLVLFFEYFQGENGRGIGASHQTGWTGLVADLIDQYGDQSTTRKWEPTFIHESV
ncbi:MAG TPA: hypothetical protein VKZ56_05470 [Membranihabitans sp.]|nr:hypothetical protein [Membranihabitans sp.]